MPEDTLRLRTELHGAAELSHLWKLFREGNIAIGEMVRLKKLLNEAFQRKIPGSEQAQELAQNLLQVNSALKAVTEQTRPMTAFGNTMRDLVYQTRGLRYEMRATHFIIAQLTHVITTTATSVAQFSGASETAKETTKVWAGTIEQAVLSGTGFYAVLRLLGPAASSVAGPIGVLAGAIAVMGQVMAQDAEKIKAFVEGGMKEFSKEIPKMAPKDAAVRLKEINDELHRLLQVATEMPPVLREGWTWFYRLIEPTTLEQVRKRVALLKEERKTLLEHQVSLLDNAQAAFEYLKTQSVRTDLTLKDKEAMVAAIKTMKDAQHQTVLLGELDQWLAQERKKEEDAKKKALDEEKKRQSEQLKGMQEIQEVMVKAMQEGTAKRIALLDLEHQKALDTLRQMKKELPQLTREINDALIAEQESYEARRAQLVRFREAEEAQRRFLETPEGQEQIRRQALGLIPSPAQTEAEKKAGSRRLMRLHGKPSAPLTEMMEKREKEAFGAFLEKPQIQVLTSGLEAVGNAIEQNIILRFKEAKSIFQIFEQAVIAGLVRILTKMLTMKIVGALFEKALGVPTKVTEGLGGKVTGLRQEQFGGLLMEPVVGVGMKTRLPYLLGERPEMVSPLFAHPGEAAVQRVVIEGTFKLDGADFRAGFKANRLLARKKALKGAGW
jgi:hypothetical protein